MTDNTDHDLARAKESLRKRTSDIREVPFSNLFVDPRFQRPLNPHHRDTIKAHYHPQGIGFILAAKVINDDGSTATGPDGETLAVLDGQTRLAAVRDLHAEATANPPLELGQRDPEIPPSLMKAEVFEELTEEEAAALFALRNDQKPVRPEDRDRIAFAAGDTIMKEVLRQASAAGYRVFSDDPEREPVTMPHREHAKRIVRWGKEQARPDLLGEVLMIQAKAFGTDIGYLNKDLMTATAEMLRKHPNLNEDELIRILSVMGLPGVVGQSEQEAARHGKRLSGAMQVVLRERYNKGKRGSEILRAR